MRTMASTAVTAACIFLLAVATQAFLLPQPALPNISRKLGLLQQQQVCVGVELGTTVTSRRS
jgi:hypothetical protein